MNKLVDEWLERDLLSANQLFVVGCSTSEVIGKAIGTSSNIEVAKKIFSALKRLKEEVNLHLAFQCCEHLNRSLVVERKTMEAYQLTEVTVIPTEEAGGAMATYAFSHLEDAVIVEEIQAHAGIDIGQTMIGMHLRPVVVPLRLKQKFIHQGNVLGALTRPKLIGGHRASYE